MLAELGTTNHLTSLFLSYPTFTVPFCTWLLIGFFKALPMAASVITTIPVVVLYMFIHRWMVEGLVAGSVKG